MQIRPANPIVPRTRPYARSRRRSLGARARASASRLARAYTAAQPSGPPSRRSETRDEWTVATPLATLPQAEGAGSSPRRVEWTAAATALRGALRMTVAGHFMYDTEMRFSVTLEASRAHTAEPVPKLVEPLPQPLALPAARPPPLSITRAVVRCSAVGGQATGPTRVELRDVLHQAYEPLS